MKSEGLLAPLEAAHHLGITSELLFQFTKRSFGPTRRLRPLPAVEQDGQTRFSRGDLDAFDSMLRGEWCDPCEGRPSIPKAILDHLRAESRNQCARCGSGVGVETAHIRPWATSRSHHPHNLIRICSACHREHDAQHSLTTEGLQAIKDRLIARTRANLMKRARPSGKYLRSPRASQNFVGREKELEVLVDALRSGRSAAVYGLAGVGKSELLLQALSRCNTGRPVLWCNIEQYRNVADVVWALRLALSIDDTVYDDGDLPSRLDAAHTCVVFDGIEQASLDDDLDAFEDTVHALFHATSDTQFVSTSQIVLHRLPTETQLRLRGLGGLASQSLLMQSCPVGGDAIHGNTDELLSFCDGHALTLKLAGALMQHYGSANAALNAIHRFGTQFVNLPGRRGHTRQTSLELCLQTAYKALPDSGRQLLWALAQAPAGVLTHYIKPQWLELDDSAEALASLRTWHLVELDIVDEQLSRARILAPVRRFAIERGSEEDPGLFRQMVGRVVHGFGMMVAVLELKYDDSEDIPYVLRRFGEELPNLVHVLELARERQDDEHLVTTALSIVESLMRYFFVLRLAEPGAQVMFRATDLAFRTGRLERASGLAVQFLALTQRTQSETLFASGLEMVNRIANASDNPEVLADVAMCRAMAAQRAGDYSRAERHARQAFESYRALLSSFEDKTGVNATIEQEDLQNDLSNALGILGFSLLSQRKYEEAARAYRGSLQHERGAAVGVNRGQVLHQIGNCESNLGKHEAAAKLYVEAARFFHSVGMEEYLSNSFGELGYTLLDVDFTGVADCLNEDIIDHSLVDLGNHAVRIFNLARPLDGSQCIGVVRKLFGMIILLSLTGYGEELGAFCVKMGNETVREVGHQTDAGIGSAEADDREELLLILMVDVSLRLGVLVAECERDLGRNGEAGHDTVERILRIVFGANERTQVTMRLLDWVAVYLTRRLGFTGIDAARIREAARNFGEEAGDCLDRIRSS